MTGEPEDPSLRTQRASGEDAPAPGNGTRTTESEREPRRWSVNVPARPATETGDADAPPAQVPPTEPPGGGGAAGGPFPPRPPREPTVESRTVFTLIAIAGGILFLGFLVSTAMGTENPLAGFLVFVGATMLIVVLIVGAAGATDLPTEARVTMGVLAALLVLLSAWGLLWVTQTPYATTCGAIAAVPGLLALRFFTVLRDGFLFARAPPGGAPAPARAEPAA